MSPTAEGLNYGSLRLGAGSWSGAPGKRGPEQPAGPSGVQEEGAWLRQIEIDRVWGHTLRELA